MIAQGEVWWADLAEPSGSEPGFRRPVVVVQGDAFNRSRIATVVCVVLTSNLRWAEAPGNVCSARASPACPRTRSPTSRSSSPSTARRSPSASARLPAKKLELVLLGVDIVLGR